MNTDTALIFDTETTGVKNASIVEAAWIEVQFEPFITINGYFQRFNPGRPIEFGAMATHHIMEEDIAHLDPSFKFKFPDRVPFIIGHQVDFDWEMAGKPDIKRICTLALSRMLWPECDSFQLGSLLYMLEGAKAKELLVNSHSSSVDVRNTKVLVENILRCLPDVKSWEDLWKVSEKARIPEIMTFGKYKLMLIKNVPIDYIHWLLKQPDLEPYLEIALKKRIGQ